MLMSIGGTGLIGALGLVALYGFGVRRGIRAAAAGKADTLGSQSETIDDRQCVGSTFQEVRDAVLDEPYHGTTWGQDGDKPLPVHMTTFWGLATGLFDIGKRFVFLDAAKRTLVSHADLRWGGPERKGVRRQLVSTALVLCCAALVLTALISLSVLAFLQSYVPDGLPGARLVSTVTLFGALTLGAGAGLVLTYRYTPAAEQAIPWRHALPGTIAGVTMWLVATTLFRMDGARRTERGTPDAESTVCPVADTTVTSSCCRGGRSSK
jgi:hypothetical protein